ncbi:Glycerol-3-phosphate regulon repressor (plasmid) [Thermus thermophilus]|uniref:DeoR family transcriptional regulator n=2 Tax=Thermus TaxID=270 RepID=A0A430R6D0_THESC|nr:MULTISPECIES: DeoR/GlpR family DNA-binding transcription regulator [Thermus]RTH02871.1 DeoR family transcriptional regulator [Thermus scotoductus]RTH06078.1 DeoR family transcriptional regulator [Thermus scotoductus]VCU54652.1 Glycerol-3-phosphate regulon repressor [Thermus thermophilus]
MPLASLRRQNLLELLRQHGGLSTKDLARHLGVSEATVRRDLAALARQGLLQRDHGGAFLPEAEPPYAVKLTQNPSQKEAIARRASAMVPDGATVILDSGTTTLALARLLAGRPLRVVVLDVALAQALAQGETEVLLPGGRVRNGFYSLVGSWTEELLSQVRADLFFLGADAFNPEGITNHTFEEAAVKRKAMAVSQRTVLLADRSKWGKRAPAFVAPLNALHLVITDLEDPTLEALVPVEVVGETL